MRLAKSSFFVLVVLSVLEISAMQSAKKIIKVGPDLGYPFSPAVRAGSLIYLAGTMAIDDQGKLATGDIRAQTRRVLDNLSAVLDASGSGLSNVVSVQVYLKSSADFQAMNEVYRGYFPKDPPARTTVVADFVLPGGLVEISMVAVPNGAERRVVHPDHWIKSPSPYSYGIQSGDTLFLSGLVSRNGKDNSVVAGDITTQTKTILDNAGEILKAAGMSHADVVSSRVFITDTELFQAMNAAYRGYFGQSPPARATVRSGLMGPQYLIEVTLVAVKGPKREAITTPNADGTPAQPSPNLSSAIRVGNRLYLSGMLGNTEATRADTAAQTRETLVRIGRTLKAAGFEWSHVVDGVVYLTDAGNFAAMNGAYREIFKADFPARATVQSGLVAPDGLVEIMFTAVK